MFEKALVTRIGNEAVDLGLLAETMFFYGSTHLLLDRGAVAGLAQMLPADELLTLIDRGELRLSYLKTGFGVASAGPLGAFNFVAINVAGTRVRPDANFKAEIEEVLERALGFSSTTRKLAKRLGDAVVLHKFKNVPEGEAVVTTLARQDIHDPAFLQRAARIVLEHLLPVAAVPQGFTFRLEDTGRGYLVDTDLDFSKLNAIYHQRISPQHSSLSQDYILSHIIASRADSFFAAEYLAEIVTTPVHSDIMRLKHYDFLRTRERSARDLELFKEVALPSAPSIREVINSGERTLSEFLKLLDRAQRFRAWLQAGNPDAELLARYTKAATEATWAEKIPTKTTRWVIASGVGAALGSIVPAGGYALATGFGLGALDMFFVDRFLKGWRPNHFIKGPYKAFVDKPTARAARA